MAVNRMQLPEFLAGRDDPGFRNLAVTLADPILNRTTFGYLLALVQEGQIGLATSHLGTGQHHSNRSKTNGSISYAPGRSDAS